MKFKTKFVLFSIAVHLIFIYALIELYPKNIVSFTICEALTIVSLIISIKLYKITSRTFQIISSGVESLKDKDFSIKLNKVGHPETDELISIYNLMIEQLREERLHQIEKNIFLEKLIEASPSGIIILDFDGKIASINSAVAELIGIQEHLAVGKLLGDIPRKLAAELSSLEINSSQVINVSGGKSYKCHKANFIDRGYARVFIIIEELTHEIYIKERQAYEKIIKIMSHEVNNSIGAINSILNSCLNYKEQLAYDNQDDYANALKVSIKRNISLSSLVSNFAKVVKIPQPFKEQINIIQLLQSVQLLMELDSADKEIEWLWDISCIKFEIYADAQQMEQVFINIIKNSIEEVKSNGKILITIKDDPKTIAISDNGSGISKELSSQLFTPFFTTKKNGQGIGLMLIREILFNHSFKFSLESNQGWTEFKIIL